MTIYDISPRLHSGVVVWPGDVGFSQTVSLDIARGDSVNLSSVEMSLHTGAHADAPLHFQERGSAIDEVDLEIYWGPARLITLPGNGSIAAAELASALNTWPKRLIVRCHPDIDPDVFPTEIRFFSPEAALLIGQMGTRLVGVDAPSVDPLDCKQLAAHHAFGQAGVAILENLLLAGVPDGEYELAALPLKISGGDASPVRAVLRAKPASCP